MTPRPATLVWSLALVVPLLLSGCSDEEVRERAEGIASQAVGEASSAASSAVRDQICRVVEDSDVSATDVEVLKGLVKGGEAAGVDPAVLDPAQRIADAGDQVPADAVAELEKACTG
jgi:hypothetical protein